MGGFPQSKNRVISKEKSDTKQKQKQNPMKWETNKNPRVKVLIQTDY